MELVLAIDDDRAVLAAVGRILRDRRIRQLCIASAEEALAIVRAQRPAAIVTVHRLPGASDLLVEVRSPRSSPRCVLHTATPPARGRRGFHVIEKGVPTPTSRVVVAALLDDGRRANDHS